MSTALADTLRSEGSSLAAKGQQNRTAMNDSAEVIIGYAEKVAENAAIYGDKTSELFAKCEASLRVLRPSLAAQGATSAPLPLVYYNYNPNLGIRSGK